MIRTFALFIVLLLSAFKVSAQAPDTTFRSPQRELKTFYKLIDAANMRDIFSGPPVTLFAPDNKAFEKLPSGMPDSLMKPDNHAQLVSLLNNHLVAGRLTVNDIRAAINLGNNATFTTLSGNKLTAKINANRNIVLTDGAGNESIIEAFNISNGSAVIYLVTSVLQQNR